MVTCVSGIPALIRIQTNVNLTPWLGIWANDTLILEWIRLKPYIDTEPKPSHEIKPGTIEANEIFYPTSVHTAHTHTLHLVRKSFTRTLNKRHHTNLHFLSSFRHRKCHRERDWERVINCVPELKLLIKPINALLSHIHTHTYKANRTMDMSTFYRKVSIYKIESFNFYGKKTNGITFHRLFVTDAK